MDDNPVTVFLYSGPMGGLVPALKAALVQAGAIDGYSVGRLLGEVDPVPVPTRDLSTAAESYKEADNDTPF